MSLTLVHLASPTPLADHIKGSIFGGLIGDAHGKPTEFIKVVDDIFKKFPGGISSFDDLKKFKLVERNFQTGQMFARYTDDTAMARVTMQVLLESRENNWNLHETMSRMTSAYIADMDAPEGWTMPGRAPGTTCKKAITYLKNRIEWHQHARCGMRANWWQGGKATDGGCGSVMRAHSFGLVFADNPEKAATWAAEHSKITHGHPMAQAACAAMAAGTAYAVQGKEYTFIIEQMIAWAKKYDPIEIRDNPHTCQQEKGTAGKMLDACASALLFFRPLTIATRDVPGKSKMIKQYRENTLQEKFEYSQQSESYIYRNGKNIFQQYEGWASDDAIAAAVYIFTLSPDNITDAMYLGVHTPGDSDSIASMAGALVGARVGASILQKNHNPANYEGSLTLEQYADRAAQLIETSK